LLTANTLPAPLKLRPYGAIQICLLLLLLVLNSTYLSPLPVQWPINDKTEFVRHTSIALSTLLDTKHDNDDDDDDDYNHNHDHDHDDEPREFIVARLCMQIDIVFL